MNRRHINFGFRLSIAILCILALVHFIDWEPALLAIAESDWRYVALCIGLAVADRYLMAFKWAMLIRALGTFITNLAAFRIYLISGFAGIFLPSSVGADIVRFVGTTISTGKGDVIAATIVMERILGLFAVAVLAVIGSLTVLIAGETKLLSVFYFSMIILLLVGLVLIVSLREDIWKYFSESLKRYKRYRFVHFVIKIHNSYIQFRRKRDTILAFYALSLIEHLFSPAVTYFSAVALGLDINFLHVLALIPVINIVSMAPVSIGGFGVREGVFVVMFSVIGLSRPEALSVALLSRAVSLIVLVLGGLLYLNYTWGTNRAVR